MARMIEPEIRSGLSIAQDLPFDVLQEIFEHYITCDRGLHVARRHNFELLLLCHICTSWRYAALKMTSIWTSTTFIIHTIRRVGPPFTLYLHPKSALFISWWEEHLSDVPPSIYLPNPPRERSSPSAKIEIDTLDEAHAVLFSGSFFRSAWSLALEILNQELDVICSDPKPFPNLVDLRIENSPSSRIPRIPATNFPPAPKLQRLHLSHADVFSRILSIFPWSQLTHLYIPRTLSINDFQVVLSHSTNLRLGALILATPIPLVFQLTGNSLVSASATSSITVVPALRHLVVASSANPIGLTFAGLSFPALVALRISSAAYPLARVTQIHELLTAVPALEELHFSNSLSFSEGEYLDFGATNTRLSALVPRLKYLVVDFIDPSRMNVGRNIIRFLQSAWLCSGWTMPGPGSGPLRQLQMVVENSSHIETNPVPDEIIEEVRSFLRYNWDDSTAAFAVSIQDSDSFGGARYIFDVFDEKLPSRGWDSALDFHTTL